MRSRNRGQSFIKHLGKWALVILGGYLCLETVFLIIFGAAAAEIFLDFLEIQQNKNALYVARAQWEAKGISHYQITVDDLNFRVGDLYACSQMEYILTIKNGEVVNNSSHPGVDCRPVYDQLTVEKTLDRVDHALATTNPFRTKVKVRFDPEFGFVSYYDIRPRIPLFSGLSDSPIVLRFSGFTVLDIQ
jgi:hypothetical protein